MIDASTLPLGTPIFSHVCDDGENIHILASALRTSVLKIASHTHIRHVPLDPKLAHDWIATNVVSPQRVSELLRRHRDPLHDMEPVLLCEAGTTTNYLPDVLFVDGHHRYVMCAALRVPLVPCFQIPFAFWQPYRIIGLPNITRDELRRRPITQRSY